MGGELSQETTSTAQTEPSSTRWLWRWSRASKMSFNRLLPIAHWTRIRVDPSCHRSALQEPRHHTVEAVLERS